MHECQHVGDEVKRHEGDVAKRKDRMAELCDR